MPVFSRSEGQTSLNSLTRQGFGISYSDTTKINFIGVATLKLDVAEQSNSAASKPEECMGDAWRFGYQLGHLDNGDK